ncbi:MAG: nucleotide-binding protein [Verrucomicrobia bacterium]|nr:nucleotide-binding protein [Verrucomicrobiota bacterium]
MTINCLLHNANTCGKEGTIGRARSDGSVRIVYAYDWHTHSDNTALIYEEVMSVINELKPKFPLKFSFRSLGAKDGSIYCDICRQIRSADIAIFDLSTYNQNVIFELGLAIGVGTYVFILRSRHYRRRTGTLSDLNGILEYRFSRRSGRLKFDTDFKQSLKRKLRNAAKRRMRAEKK